jgi:membrane protease YdiL (CAAX protease family)
VKRLEPGEIAPRQRYERLRPDYRARIIALKQDRRVAVGDRVTVVFENRETLRFQIQEMCRVERIDNPARVQGELDVYNELVPGERELSATLFIEIPDLERIRSELDRLVGIDEHVYLRIGDERIPARFDPKQMEADRISAVQYIRFTLDPEQAARFADPALPVELAIAHPNYRHATPLEPATRASLAADLEGECPPLLEVGEGMQPTPPADAAGERIRVRTLGPGHVVVEPNEPAGAASALAADDPELLGRLAAEAERRAAAAGPSARIELEAGGDRPRWHVRGPRAGAPGLLGAAQAAGLLAVYLGMQALGGVGIGMAGALMVLARGGNPRDTVAATQAAQEIQAPVGIAFAILGGLLVLALVLRRARRGAGPALLRQVGLVPARPASLAAALAIGALVAGAYLAMSATIWRPEPRTVPGPTTQMMVQGGWQRELWTYVGLLAAPPVEELVFRGALFAGFAHSWGVPTAAVVTSVVFVGLHYAEFQSYAAPAIGLTAMALVTLALRIRTGSVWPAVAAHFGYNATIIGVARALMAFG